MKILKVLGSLVLISSLNVNVIAGPSHFFEHVHEFMIDYVEDGMVDYERVLTNSNELNTLLSMVEYGPHYPVRGVVDPNIHKAFWINAYNLLVIKSVVDNYPLKSPMDVPGFFDKTLHKAAGKKLTLNDIENKILRKTYDDPRIHFALVCAARSCPILKSGAYFPDDLDTQLTVQTEKAMDDPKFIRLNGIKKKVEVSEIFKWYRDDFKAHGDIRGFINKYKNRQLPSDYTLAYYTYDWKLNDKGKKP